MQSVQIGIGRRWLVVTMGEREGAAPRAARLREVDVEEHAHHERRIAALGREQDRAAARAMGWWYGLYGTGR